MSVPLCVDVKAWSRSGPPVGKPNHGGLCSDPDSTRLSHPLHHKGNGQPPLSCAACVPEAPRPAVPVEMLVPPYRVIPSYHLQDPCSSAHTHKRTQHSTAPAPPEPQKSTELHSGARPPIRRPSEHSRRSQIFFHGSHAFECSEEFLFCAL